MDVGPAFSICYLAGLCSGLWHRAAVCRCIGALSSPVAQAKLFCIVSAEIFLHFKRIAHNSFPIRQLRLILFVFFPSRIYFYLQPGIYNCSWETCFSLFSYVLLRLTFITKSLTEELLFGNPRCLVWGLTEIKFEHTSQRKGFSGRVILYELRKSSPSSMHAC